MNIFKKIYCRVFQTAFRLALPILPYREPNILKSNEDIVNVLIENNVSSVLLVTDAGIYGLGLCDSLEKLLKKSKINVVVYKDTVPNPTTDNVDSALSLYKEQSCQAIIAFGGGSAMDCAKATGARVVCPNKPLSKMKGVLKVGKALPLLIAIPTTAGTGSETTLAAVITDSVTRHKYAINDFPLIPKYAMLSAPLTVGLPKHITATTGMDALTHAVEAYIGRSTTKDTRKHALDAVKLIFENLLQAYEHGDDLVARENMLIASYKAGLAFTKSYVGNIHAVAHTLGGKYNTPHGLANAVIMPHVLKKYGKTIYKKLYNMGVYAGLFSVDTPIEVGAKLFIEKIESLNEAMGIPTFIADLKAEDIPSLAVIAEKEANPLYPVPQIYSNKELEDIYRSILNNK